MSAGDQLRSLADAYGTVTDERPWIDNARDAMLHALAPDLARWAADAADALAALTFPNYRGIVCAECGWDASHHPPEITACLSCGGELVARVAAKAYSQHSDALLARLGEITGGAK